MFRPPPLFLGVPVFAALCWDVLRRIKNDTPDIDMELIYVEAEAKEVQTLNILRMS